METKFTKGEWILKEQGDASEYCILTPEHRWVVAFRLNGERMAEEIANAKLIAAAPDLLEALQSLMKGVEGLPPLTAIAGTLVKQYKQAEAAIKKATE